MAGITVEEVFNMAKQLSSEERSQLMDLLETMPSIEHVQNDPLLALIGAWADMGDEEIDAFEREIRRSREAPGREVNFEE